jgi:hypothetical protein
MSHWSRVALLGATVIATGAACGNVESGDGGEPDAAAPPMIDAAAGAALGSEGNPAAGCVELRDMVGRTSGTYWVRHPDPARGVLEVYCEQVVEDGGWALLYNSVFRLDGSTTAFWTIPHASRFLTKGQPALAENYYAGSHYLLGTAFLDTITDVGGTTAVAARVDSEGIDPDTMKFRAPTQVGGLERIFKTHFAAGWSAPDYDGDDRSNQNCAVEFAGVTQHYGACWDYNLGADAEEPRDDGGVGPHVNGGVLAMLGLAAQPDGGGYSRVQRISRFVRF